MDDRSHDAKTCCPTASGLTRPRAHFSPRVDQGPRERIGLNIIMIISTLYDQLQCYVYYITYDMY